MNENENSVKKSRGRPPKNLDSSSLKSQENTLKNNSVLLNDSLQSNEMDTTGTKYCQDYFPLLKFTFNAFFYYKKSHLKMISILPKKRNAAVENQNPKNLLKFLIIK